MNESVSSDAIVCYFKQPLQLYAPQELRAMKSKAMPASGIYCWYFHGIPNWIPLDNCYRVNGLVLSYIGIAPKREPKSPANRTHLRRRLVSDHLGRYSSRSTLRRALGALLLDQLRLTPQLYSNGKPWFGQTEPTLTSWLNANAMVAFLGHDSPWDVEAQVIAQLSPLVNISHNERQPLRAQLAALRAKLNRK